MRENPTFETATYEQARSLGVTTGGIVGKVEVAYQLDEMHRLIHEALISANPTVKLTPKGPMTVEQFRMLSALTWQLKQNLAEAEIHLSRIAKELWVAR